MASFDGLLGHFCCSEWDDERMNQFRLESRECNREWCWMRYEKRGRYAIL